jgi:hypothetical protein
VIWLAWLRLSLGRIGKDFPRIAKGIEAFGEVALVIIDTSAAVFTGDDENDNPQMLAHAKKQRAFCEIPGRPTVIALCHPTKHVASQEQLLPRGGGSYFNETDGDATLWAHDDRLSDLYWTGNFRGPRSGRRTAASATTPCEHEAARTTVSGIAAGTRWARWNPGDMRLQFSLWSRLPSRRASLDP